MIQITLLGVSALLPLPERAETAALLQCGGHSILFDCGEGTQTAARKAGVSLMKTDIIALTHYHGDHIFGLPGLLQTIHMMGRREPLILIGPGDMAQELAHLLALAGRLPFEIKLISLPEEGLALNTLSGGWPEGARLTPFATAHRVLSQGYVFDLPRAGKFLPEKARALGIPPRQWGRFQKGEMIALHDRVILPQQVMGPPRRGLKVVFSGDTAACPALEEAARGADLLLCEATYGENDQDRLAAEHGHMNFAQAGKIARDAAVRRLWLMHFSQMIEDPLACLPNAQAFFPAAECGWDGKSITLPFDPD